MYSSVGRKTANLHPQLQLDSTYSRLKSLKQREPVFEREKPRKREADGGKEEFFFYNILDYNKEAASKLREVSYVPKVERISSVDRRPSRWKVQTQV